MSHFFSNYHPANASLWQGRQDHPGEERYFQRVQCLSLLEHPLPMEKQTVFLGFASDAGIIRNQGRPGAKYGPDQIRTQLAKLACQRYGTYLDIGNISCEDDNLETAQEELAKLISQCHQEGHKTIVFGGGHEIAWPHFKGLSPYYPKMAIINFDAHFDLRPLVNGYQGTSGTPFTQIAQYCKEQQSSFAYCCLGIQPQGNTHSLFEQAEQLNVSYLTAENINENSLAWQTAFLDNFMLNYDYIYLTICLDVFSECFAPGVSAPQALGISPWQAVPLLKYIVQTGKVVSVDIAELSPPLDPSGKTARLAAILIAKLLEVNQDF
ncbi:formimidoylglutamase [Legionella israelensis]|uniref:formimidoylglutamase n=1 Tax=Legionella israelensis TaxID=454 RepID=UPI00117E45F7|nr:formimidoylglutamase [Legionella israelensis]QDP73160.1 formimidoylglutamase [Legionella israelensis]